MIVFVGPGVGHVTNLVLPGEGIFESFFARRGTDVGMDLTADSDRCITQNNSMTGEG